MFVHFENWSSYARATGLGISKDEHVIKAYASFANPIDFFERDNLSILEFNHDKLSADEVFEYEGRKGYTGTQLEFDLSRAHEMSLRFQPLAPLDDLAKRTARTLIRLMHSNELPVGRDAMLAKNIQGDFYFDHPFSVLHGFERLDREEIRSLSIHLDIIAPRSLALLKKVVDWEDKERLLTTREGIKLREHDLQMFGKEGNTNPRKES